MSVEWHFRKGEKQLANLVLNAFLISVGTFIGIALTSCCVVAGEADEKEKSYQSGYREGYIQGKADGYRDERAKQNGK